MKMVLKARKRRLPEHIRNLSDEAWLDLIRYYSRAFPAYMPNINCIFRAK
jgi:hypothetical protein